MGAYISRKLLSFTEINYLGGNFIKIPRVEAVKKNISVHQYFFHGMFCAGFSYPG
jgi:hypothetical protein